MPASIRPTSPRRGARRRVAASLLVCWTLLAACGPGDPVADEVTVSVVPRDADSDADADGTASDPDTDAPAVTPAATSPAVAPTGAPAGVDAFDVRADGFSFENYGNDPGVVNLLPADVARMFGPAACAIGAGDACVLTPPADAWMEQMNEMMSGGHCEGMAVLSLLMQQGKVDPLLFGGPTVGSLALTGNERLQREIAFWFITQALTPTADAAVRGAPSMVVERLRRWLAGNDAQGGYTLGIYQPDGSDGHAVTPIGVEDVGPNRVDILIYDNNHPGVVRRIEVDTAADTWAYQGATNPDEEEGRYEGDAESASIELTPLVVRLAPQAAPFIGDPGEGDDEALATRGATGGGRTEVYLDPAAFRAGVTMTVQAPGGGALPGVSRWVPRGADLWDLDAPAVVRVPAGAAFEIVLDAAAATGPADTDIAIIGPGFDAGVDAIVLEPGQRDVVAFDPATMTLRYTTTADESPSVTISQVAEGADVDFTFGGVELGAGGGTLEARLDTAADTLLARSTGGSAVVLFEIARYSDRGVEGFENDGVDLAPGETLVIDFGRWAGDAAAVPAGIDVDGDGIADESFEIVDER